MQLACFSLQWNDVKTVFLLLSTQPFMLSLHFEVIFLPTIFSWRKYFYGLNQNLGSTNFSWIHKKDDIRQLSWNFTTSFFIVRYLTGLLCFHSILRSFLVNRLFAKEILLWINPKYRSTILAQSIKKTTFGNWLETSQPAFLF